MKYSNKIVTIDSAEEKALIDKALAFYATGLLNGEEDLSEEEVDKIIERSDQLRAKMQGVQVA